MRTNTSTWTMRVDPTLGLTTDVPNQNEHCVGGISIDDLSPGEIFTWTSDFIGVGDARPLLDQIWESFCSSPGPLEIPLTVTG